MFQTTCHGVRGIGYPLNAIASPLVFSYRLMHNKLSQCGVPADFGRQEKEPCERSYRCAFSLNFLISYFNAIHQLRRPEKKTRRPAITAFYRPITFSSVTENQWAQSSRQCFSLPARPASFSFSPFDLGNSIPLGVAFLIFLCTTIGRYDSPEARNTISYVTIFYFIRLLVAQYLLSASRNSSGLGHKTTRKHLKLNNNPKSKWIIYHNMVSEFLLLYFLIHTAHLAV